MITKEYVCAAHGYFEAGEPTCPSGCKGESMVTRIFTQAPAIQTQGFRNMNRTFEVLAAEAGMSNLNNAGGDGMRRMTYEDRKRVYDEAASLGYTKSGMPIDDMFKPVGEAAGRMSAEASGLAATQAAGIKLPQLRPNLGGLPAFDGSKAGLPSGD
jgi:hypothetical protein